MARMPAAQVAVEILKNEGVTHVFGLPGAAINPFYNAMRTNGGLKHILARHVEGASHMAEGYTRATPGNIGVCVGTSGPAGTDMITGLYSASADSIPILCITGQAPTAKLHKEDFQAVDIAADCQIADQTGGHGDGTGASSGDLPASFSSHAVWSTWTRLDRPANRRPVGRG